MTKLERKQPSRSSSEMRPAPSPSPRPPPLVLRGANSVTYSVAQVSKPAVSRISKSASALTKDGLPTGKSAIQQVWKPALRHRICARLHLAWHDDAFGRLPASGCSECFVGLVQRKAMGD